MNIGDKVLIWSYKADGSEEPKLQTATVSNEFNGDFQVSVRGWENIWFRTDSTSMMPLDPRDPEGEIRVLDFADLDKIETQMHIMEIINQLKQGAALELSAVDLINIKVMMQNPFGGFYKTYRPRVFEDF